MLRLNSNPDLKLGDVTTVNWTITEVSVLDLLIFFFLILEGSCITILLFLHFQEGGRGLGILNLNFISLPGWRGTIVARMNQKKREDWSSFAQLS